MAVEKIVVAVVGIGGVGKSSCTLRYTKNVFHDQYDPTVEETYTKTETVGDKTVNLELIDTAGQDDYETFRNASIDFAHGLLVVYSVTSRASFDGVIEFLETAKSKFASGGDLPCVLVANKVDLVEAREVAEPEGQKLAGEFKIPYVETSAKSGQNISQAFEQIVKRTYDSEARKAATANPPSSTPAKEEGGCCILQ